MSTMCKHFTCLLQLESQFVAIVALFKRSDLDGVDKITTYILLKKLKDENLIKVIEEFYLQHIYC
jgi:hypothetical protein